MAQSSLQEIYVSVPENEQQIPFVSHYLVPTLQSVSRSNQSGPGPPPSYEECHDLNNPPPSYESLFGNIKEMEKNSTGVCDFFKKIFIFIFGTAGCTVMVGITVIIPTLMIILGSLKMDECPAGSFIPIYLIVGGALGILKNVMNFNNRYKLGLSPGEESGPLPWHKRLHFHSFLNFFLTSWFVSGCVSVYSIYEPEYFDHASPRYCDYTLYVFTFWLITSVFVTAGLLSSCLCSLSVFTVILQRYQSPSSLSDQ